MGCVPGFIALLVKKIKTYLLSHRGLDPKLRIAEVLTGHRQKLTELRGPDKISRNTQL